MTTKPKTNTFSDFWTQAWKTIRANSRNQITPVRVPKKFVKQLHIKLVDQGVSYMVNVDEWTGQSIITLMGRSTFGVFYCNHDLRS